MAILSKIRDRSIAMIAVIGLALFAFVIDPSKLSDFFSSSKVNAVGEVNGETITRQEFAEALKEYTTRSNGRVTEMQAAKVVWDNLVRQKIYKAQLENAGIKVGDEDVWFEVINSPSILQNPSFKNEAGLFDENKLKQFLVDIKENDQALYNSWQLYLNQIKENLENTTYNDLIAAGIGASLAEGKFQYYSDNTKINADYVYLPYSSIPDSLVTVTKSEIETYIKEHASQYETEATRSISYVKFEVEPSAKDEEALKQEVEGLLQDRKVFNNVTKREETLIGFKNTSDYDTFFEENESAIQANNSFLFKNSIPAPISNDIVEGKEGDVFGPYKEGNYFKLAKIREIKRLPDSAKASHILIPFVGALRAGADIERTEAEAKQFVDSLYTVLKRNRSNFSNFAKEYSSDTGSKEKGGFYDWFGYNRMTPEFRDFVFENKTGDMSVVKTPFGYHIIKIDGQKNMQQAYKLAIFARQIEASEETENLIFREAEQFALDISNGKEFTAVAKEKNQSVRPVVGLKVLDENIPGVGNQRQIVTWAFKEDTKPGSFKRFDIEKGFVVAMLTKITQKGLQSPAQVMNQVKPILVKEKKASILAGKLSGESLEAIATANNTNVRKASNVNVKSPTIAGVGNEPKVVGAIYYAALNQLNTSVVGEKGVFAFSVTSREEPTALPNYETTRDRIASSRQSQTFKMYEAIKNASDIEDNRAVYYGIEN